MSIELLLTTLFYTYMRPLVEAGKLYRAVTPLYIISCGKEKTYCYSDQELEDWKASNVGKKFDLLRAKGLGEIDSRTLQDICFKHERYKRITISDAEETTKLLEILMGKNADVRKQYIYENATELGFQFD